MSMRTQLAKQDLTKSEKWVEIETLIRETASSEHVSFACSYHNAFQEANGFAREVIVSLKGEVIVRIGNEKSLVHIGLHS